MRTEKDFEQYLENIKQVAAEEGYDTLDSTYIEHLKCRFFGQELVIGRSARIILREMKISDLEAFYGFEDAKEESVLQTFLKESREASEEHLGAYIANMYPMFDYGIWTVERVEDGAVIGMCGLGNPTMDGAECTDLGYYICPKCRNQGFATEAVEIALDYAKNYLEFPLICAIIKKENRISEGILRKFGFQYVKQYENTDQKTSVYQKELEG